MQHVDGLAVRVERGPGGENDARGGGDAGEQDKRESEPAQCIDQTAQRGEPTRMGVDPRGRCHAAHSGPEPGECSLVRQVDLDQRGLGQTEFIGTQPRLHQRLQLRIRQALHPGDARQGACRGNHRRGLRVTGRLVRLRHLHRHPARDLIPQGPRRARQRQPGGGREQGEKGHDRDHPWHRPGTARLGKQPPFGRA